MILIISDESGESVYDGVLRASYDSVARRVTFIDPTSIEPRGVNVNSGSVTLVDHGVTFKRWTPSAAPTLEVQ